MLVVQLEASQQIVDPSCRLGCASSSCVWRGATRCNCFSTKIRILFQERIEKFLKESPSQQGSLRYQHDSAWSGIATNSGAFLPFLPGGSCVVQARRSKKGSSSRSMQSSSGSDWQASSPELWAVYVGYRLYEHQRVVSLCSVAEWKLLECSFVAKVYEYKNQNLDPVLWQDIWSMIRKNNVLRIAFGRESCATRLGRWLGLGKKMLWTVDLRKDMGWQF